MEQWPPQQVMILPMTDEIIQRYLNPQEIHRLRTPTSTSPTYKKSAETKRTVSQIISSFKQNFISILDSKIIKKINNNIRTIRY